jgi:hypothetical protein
MDTSQINPSELPPFPEGEEKNFGDNESICREEGKACTHLMGLVENLA